MGFFSNLFSGAKEVNNPVKWDMHNHILFGIDDGSKTLENSILMAREFEALGYKRLVATPHIMGDYYPNTGPIISERAGLLNKALKEQGVDLEVAYAAEYYMDEALLEKVAAKEELLTFHGRHVLVETSFLNKPMFFNQLVFDLKTQGYIPVFAHPERYVYLHNAYEELERLAEQGLKLQINLLSLLGYYSPAVKKLAQWMVKHGHYNFLGTDAHNIEQLKLLPEVFKSRIFDSLDLDKIENCR